MIKTVETEIVRAHTRLDGVDARLKSIEKKLDRHAVVIIGAITLASVLGPAVGRLIGL